MRTLLTVLALPVVALAGSVAVRLAANRVRVAVTGVITPDVAAAFIGALDAAPAGRAVLVELDSPAVS